MIQSVSDYMATKVATISGDKTIADAVALMRSKNLGSLVVKDSDKIVGIFTERDLITKADYRKPQVLLSTRIKDVMTKDVVTVPDAESYVHVIELMQKHRIRHMPVSREGRIVGMVSLRDLLGHYQEALEVLLREKEKELLENLDRLKESEERFRVFFYNSAVALTLADTKERLIAWNPAVLRLLGMTEEELKDKPVRQLYPREEWQRMRALNIRRLGIKNRLETKIINKQGELVDIELSISVMKGAQGKSIGSIGVMSDITERKKLERIREEFAGIVSHELRTPLVPIREGVSQVLDGVLGETTKEQKEFLGIVLSEIDRLRRIIDNLLDIFKLESGKMKLKKELVDITALAHGVVSTFTPRAQKKSLEIKLHFSAEPLEAYVDKDRMTQVFANLLGNAVKFTEEGNIEISVIDKPGLLECSVRDTGKGIDIKDVPRLFKKFQQLAKSSRPEEAGTGLGLAICKDIVELHRGEIWVESQLGQWTKFIFTVPKTTPEDLFSEYVTESLRETVEKGKTFSVAIFDIKNTESTRKKVGTEKVTAAIVRLAALGRENLRDTKDIVITTASGIFLLVPETTKDAAVEVAQRIQQKFDDYLVAENLGDAIQMSCRVASFTSEDKTAKELLREIEKARLQTT